MMAKCASWRYCVNNARAGGKLRLESKNGASVHLQAKTPPRVILKVVARDDLLARDEEMYLGPLVQSTVNTMLANFRDRLTTHMGVPGEEEIIVQAWIETKLQWNSLHDVLGTVCARGKSDLTTNSHNIYVRICRAELRHLFDDNLPPPSKYRG